MRCGRNCRFWTPCSREDRTAICGPRYAHQAERTVSRAGTVASTVVLGGRKRRPRVRSGRQEVPLPTFQAMAQTDPLRRRTVEQLLVGVNTRGYAQSLEPLPADIPSRSVSKSAVSRWFVAKTASQLAAWQATPLDELDLVGLLLDCVHIGEHCVVLALGIGVDGTKHALGLWEGSMENATVCQSLLANLQSRGLRTDRSILMMLDGSKALRAAVKAVFGRAAPPGHHIDGNGLYLHVQPTRARSWIHRLVIRGKRCELGLGSTALVSLAEAREKAVANRKLAREGCDPLADKRRLQSMPTFADAAAAVIEQKRPGWSNPEQERDWRNSLRRYAFPRIGNRPVIVVLARRRTRLQMDPQTPAGWRRLGFSGGFAGSRRTPCRPRVPW